MAPDLLKNEKWTKKEDATILSKRLEHETFPNIAKLLKNGRSENNVKNRYHKLIKDNSNSSTNSNVQSVNRSNKNNDDDSDDDDDDDDDKDDDNDDVGLIANFNNSSLSITPNN